MVVPIVFQQIFNDFVPTKNRWIYIILLIYQNLINKLVPKINNNTSQNLINIKNNKIMVIQIQIKHDLKKKTI